MHIIELIQGRLHVEELNALLFVGIALFGGTIGGRLFQRLRIPQVIGYIIIGLILGESGLRFMTAPTLARFEPINFVALGLISFSLGGELKLDMLKRNGKQFTYLLFFEAFGAFFLVSLAAYLPLSMLFPTNAAMAISLLLGSISAATAAAGTTDVLWEYRAKGEVTSTLLGIIALDDILSLFIFTILASILAPMLGFGGGNFLFTLFHPVYETFGAVLLGMVAGNVLIWLLKKYTEEERVFVFSMGAIFLVLGFSRFLEVDMLMTAMIMGAVVVNKAPRKSKLVFGLIERFSTPIYVLFFVFVGATLKFNALSFSIVLVIVVFIIARFLGKLAGIKLGGRLSGASKKIRKYLPLCLLSQSGVAVGLAIISAQKFPGIVGDTILMVVTTSTFIVQLLGPAFIKVAIQGAGEAGKNITEENLKEQYHLSDVLEEEGQFVKEGTPIQRVIHQFASSRLNQLGVINSSGELIGVITFDNLKGILASPEINFFLLAVDVMSPVPLTASMEISLREAEKLMRRSGVDYVAVVGTDKQSRGMVEQRMIDGFSRRKYLELQEA